MDARELYNKHINYTVMERDARKIVLKDNLVGIRIFEHDILNKSIDTYDLMDYIAQTIVAPSKQSNKLLVNKNMFAHMQSLNEGRQVYI